MKEKSHMSVYIKFIGFFRTVAGKDKFTLKLERSVSLRKVVDKIIEQRPKLKPFLIDSELGESRHDVLILVNGREISVLKGLETMVEDEDELVFVPVSHGG
jgi:molybdopterin converting factor small subunit